MSPKIASIVMFDQVAPLPTNDGLDNHDGLEKNKEDVVIYGNCSCSISKKKKKCFSFFKIFKNTKKQT
jgi:hypothetical protein